jgi:hypothetical protein
MNSASELKNVLSLPKRNKCDIDSEDKSQSDQDRNVWQKRICPIGANCNAEGKEC